MRKNLSWSYLFAVIGVAGCASGQDQLAWSPFRAEREKAAEREQAPQRSEPVDSVNREIPQAPARYVSSGPPAFGAGQPPAVASQRLDGLMADGIQAIREQRLDAARQSFLEVLRAVPDHPGAHHGLAMVADLKQQWPESEYHYKLALKSRPRDAGLLNDLGYSYLLQGNLHEASRYLNQAVEVSPQHEKAHENLATMALRQGDRAGAEARLRSIYPAAAALQHVARIEQQLSLSSSEPAAQPNTPTQFRPDATFEEIRRLAAQERQAAEDERLQKLRPSPATDSPRMTDPQPLVESRAPGLVPESTAPSRPLAQQQGTAPRWNPPSTPTEVQIRPAAGTNAATGPTGPTQNSQVISSADHSMLPPLAAFEPSPGRAAPPPVSRQPDAAALFSPAPPAQDRLPVNTFAGSHNSPPASQLLPAGQPGPVRALGLYQAPAAAAAGPAAGTVAMHLAGLNAGPGALFPVGQGTQYAPAETDGSARQPLPGLTPPSQTTLSGYSPSPTPTAAFTETPASYGPTGSTLAPAVPSQVSLQSPAGMIPMASPQPAPGGRPPADNLAEYERQLRALESQYQRTLEQMSRHTCATGSVGSAANPGDPRFR